MPDPRPRLLIGEDEVALGRALSRTLPEHGFEVKVVDRGDLVIPAIAEFGPDLVVLDDAMPGLSGLEVLRILRSRGERIPVLMATGKGDVIDKVVGLELGADDYLPKPYEIRELVARVRAVLRRTGGEGRASPAVVVGQATFDFKAMTARGPEGPLDLTRRAVEVLRLLVQRAGETVSRTDIMEEVWGLDSEATERTVDNHVVALRRAIGDDPRRPRLIVSVRSVGYRLDLPVQSVTLR